MSEGYEYKIILTSRNVGASENELNDLAKKGWVLVSGTDNLMYLSRKLSIGYLYEERETTDEQG